MVLFLNSWTYFKLKSKNENLKTTTKKLKLAELIRFLVLRCRFSFLNFSFYFYFILLRRINMPDFFFLFLVFLPPVILPWAVLGLLVPRPCLPSPPPYGWSTGFIAVPLTLGLIPNHLLLPALPTLTSLFSSLETSPTEAQQVSRTFLTSEDGSFKSVCPASCATTSA